jgi:hypothetical protein
MQSVVAEVDFPEKKSLCSEKESKEEFSSGTQSWKDVCVSLQATHLTAVSSRQSLFPIH